MLNSASLYSWPW